MVRRGLSAFKFFKLLQLLCLTHDEDQRNRFTWVTQARTCWCNPKDCIMWIPWKYVINGNAINAGFSVILWMTASSNTISCSSMPTSSAPTVMPVPTASSAPTLFLWEVWLLARVTSVVKWEPVEIMETQASLLYDEQHWNVEETKTFCIKPAPRFVAEALHQLADLRHSQRLLPVRPYAEARLLAEAEIKRLIEWSSWMVLVRKYAVLVEEEAQ